MLMMALLDRCNRSYPVDLNLDRTGNLWNGSPISCVLLGLTELPFQRRRHCVDTFEPFKGALMPFARISGESS